MVRHGPLAFTKGSIPLSWEGAPSTSGAIRLPALPRGELRLHLKERAFGTGCLPRHRRVHLWWTPRLGRAPEGGRAGAEVAEE